MLQRRCRRLLPRRRLPIAISRQNCRRTSFFRRSEFTRALFRGLSEPLISEFLSVSSDRCQLPLQLQISEGNFSYSSLPPPSPPLRFMRYENDAKVVVSVTVEGSPGPVRVMLKLGSTVDETIRLVLLKYREEGRSPRFGSYIDGSLELHDSCFSLQGLNKGDLIGDTGRRRFHLRRSNGGSRRLERGEHGFRWCIFSQEGIGKVVKCSRKLLKVLLCMQCI